MFRIVVICLFMTKTWGFSEGRQNPVIEYLSNFNIPGFGDPLTRLINDLRRSLPGPNLDGENRVTTRNFNFTQWSAFGGCSKVCGGGSRVRSRSCLNETGHEVTIDNCFSSLTETYDLYKIIGMQQKLKESEEELCNKHECKVSPWELDNSCSRKCGGGVMTYSRTCYDSVDQKKCNFQTTRLVPCNTDACFTVGPWQEWSRCTAPCGGGRSSRKRDCRPNVPEFSPLYGELMAAMEHVTQPAVVNDFQDENEIFYFFQYLSSCGSSLVQSRFCNAEPCPSCPKNQIYHTCKPCVRQCKKVHMTSISDLKFDLPELQLHPHGCGGVCNPGCGCNAHEPLLGMDGGCYMADLMCPQNQLSQTQRSLLIFQHFNRIANSKPTTTTPTTTKTTLPAPVGKLLCPKDIPILDKNYCECTGEFRQISCVAQDGAACPYECVNQPTCPNSLSPRLKSTEECKNPECSHNFQCQTGYLCCELLCGRRCIEIN